MPKFEVVRYDGKPYLIGGMKELDGAVTQQINVYYTDKNPLVIGNVYPVHKGDFISVLTTTPSGMTYMGYYIDAVLENTLKTLPTDFNLVISR